jgi:hypothetical protein
METKKLKIMTHYKYFTASINEILNILLSKSNELDITNTTSKLHNGHQKLRTTCENLKKCFANNNQNDISKIIKKIYKTLTTHIDKFYPRLLRNLFTLKNEEGSIITIIPGVDMNLSVSMMNDDELLHLWDYMCVMYVSSVSIISLINEHKKGKVLDILPEIRDKVIKSGVLNNESMTNPFFGISSEPFDTTTSTEKYDVNTMFSNVNNEDDTDINDTSSGDMIDSVLMSGVGKLIDISQLNEQLKNVKQEDMDEATRSITKLLGAEGDSDVSEVCNTLVEGIVSDLQLNSDKGFKGLYDTARSVSQRIGTQIDKTKMNKTVDKLTSFIQDGESNLKNLKGPLEMIQNMKNGKNGQPDMKNIASMFATLTKTMNSTSTSTSSVGSKP